MVIMLFTKSTSLHRNTSYDVKFFKIGQIVAVIFQFFQDGGRPPSWICGMRIWTTHEEYDTIRYDKTILMCAQKLTDAS